MNGTHFKCVLVYDNASRAKRPGLVMVPNWSGINDIAIAKAQRIGKAYEQLKAQAAHAPIDTTGNCRYDAKAAARSYRMTRDWLAESFGTDPGR